MSSRWSVLQNAAEAASRIPEARMSRRQALRRGALASAGVAGLSMLDAAPALAWWGSQPRPIPGGVDASFTPVAENPAWHFSYPAFGFEAITITDFHGVMGRRRDAGVRARQRRQDLHLRHRHAVHARHVRRDGRPHARGRVRL